ncbi:hypothetical protein BGW36DRAFT_396892 [Talaromyces proteolyticus]|uniref:Uncharacterized protein n=1 Tax=Talaromyces proteolyticus TaxID=1131652 RepID=A0AAD4KU08_9EURO|nr:uncharacterized protein BGW36DRAFT_396892 [Talaromyces proteolyticus]KAH8697075.1 hypothetical protein BGW36DRAFT_396892 [Talaromyces proteolyticus]
MANNLIPLIILFLVVGVLGVVGFVVYTIVQDISNKTKANMEKKNIMFTKDGVKVSMKHVKDEDYKDQTQSVLVNVWNHTSFPGYKSRLWDNGATPEPEKKVTRR